MIVIYHERASDEIAEATAYYARERPELGSEFLAEFNASTD